MKNTVGFLAVIKTDLDITMYETESRQLFWENVINEHKWINQHMQKSTTYISTYQHNGTTIVLTI